MAIAERERTVAAHGDPPRWEGFEHQYIAGKWRPGSAGGMNRNVNPYTRKTLVEIPLAGEADLDAACRAALGAQPAWASALPMERARVMARAAEVMEVHQEEIVSWLIREAGSTRLKAGLDGHRSMR